MAQLMRTASCPNITVGKEGEKLFRTRTENGPETQSLYFAYFG